jgi:FtsZ-binding cell division protein ZapB
VATIQIREFSGSDQVLFELRDTLYDALYDQPPDTHRTIKKFIDSINDVIRLIEELNQECDSMSDAVDEARCHINDLESQINGLKDELTEAQERFDALCDSFS